MSFERGRRAVMKGKNGEREFCRKVAALTDGRVQLRRNLAQCRDSGDDCGVYNFSIEIKRWQKVSDTLVRNWWCQCQRNAAKHRKVPVLAFRADQQAWKVMMHPNYFFEESDVRGCVLMDIELFCKYLQNTIAMFEKPAHAQAE